MILFAAAYTSENVSACRSASSANPASTRANAANPAPPLQMASPGWEDSRPGLSLVVQIRQKDL